MAGAGLALLGAVLAPTRATTPVASAGSDEAAEHAAHLDFMPTVPQALQHQKDCVLPAVLAVECVGVGTPMVYNGGNIQTAPKAYIVFWGWNPSSNDPDGEAARQESFFTQLGGSAWFNSQTQYCQSTNLTTLVSCSAGDTQVGNPTGSMLGGTMVDTTNAIPNNPDDAAIQAEAIYAAKNLFHTFGSSSAQIIVDTPHGNSTTGFGTQWCSYHGAAFDLSSGVNTYYTDFPYIPDAGTGCGLNFVNSGSAGTLDGVTIVGGHEFAETATDALPGRGWTDAAGQETGDKCAWIQIGPGAAADRNGYAVQSLWSNDANSGAGGCAI